MEAQRSRGVRWEWISEAWQMFTRQWSTWVLMMLVLYLIVFAVYVPFMFIVGALTPTPTVDGDVVVAPVFPTGMVLVLPLLYLALFAAIAWLSGGIYQAGFKQLRGEPISVGDLFSGGPYFARMLGAIVIIAVLAGIGALLCLVPGLIVYGLTLLTFPIIVASGKGTIDAIKTSIEVTKQDWLMFTLFAIVLYAIASLGVLACGVGILATMPILFLSQVLAYRDCVGVAGARGYDQYMPPPPPDYRPSAASYIRAAPPTPPITEPPPEPTTSICPRCGATLTRAANFCNQCGQMLRPS
jgi:hypothetical protein